MKKLILLAGFSVLTVSCAPTHGYHGDKQAKIERMADHYFDKMDTNDDDVVTRREHDAFSRTKFNEADTNDDNVITRGELREAKFREKRAYKGEYRSGHDRDDDYVYYDRDGDGYYDNYHRRRD